MNKMPMKKMFVPLFTLMLVASCKSTSNEPKLENAALEPIYSMNLSADSVRFGVKSNGCTRADDFVVILDTTEKEQGLSILRTRKDLCRRKPKVIELDLSIDALELDTELPMKLKNPLVAKTKKTNNYR